MEQKDKFISNLLEILACPDCKQEIICRDNKIVCKACHQEYQWQDGILALLPREGYCEN